MKDVSTKSRYLFGTHTTHSICLPIWNVKKLVGEKWSKRTEVEKRKKKIYTKYLR